MVTQPAHMAMGCRYKLKNSLRVQRAIKNITQAELADLVKVSRQTINTVESNQLIMLIC